MACLRLVTLPPFPPLPDRSFPSFSRRSALSTLLPAALPYFRMLVSSSTFREPVRTTVDIRLRSFRRRNMRGTLGYRHLAIEAGRELL